MGEYIALLLLLLVGWGLARAFNNQRWQRENAKQLANLIMALRPRFGGESESRRAIDGHASPASSGGRADTIDRAVARPGRGRAGGRRSTRTAARDYSPAAAARSRASVHARAPA